MFCQVSSFFFKQKTAYEMRISDWSSDVCSSDLLPAGHRIALARDLEMTDHGLFADAEDAGGLAGGLAARRPEHAFALPLGQRRPPRVRACPNELTPRRDRHGTDALGAVEHLSRAPGTGRDGTGRATARLSGQVSPV